MRTANILKTFYYCPECYILMDLKQRTYNNCMSCHARYAKIDLKRNGHYFIHMLLKDQFIIRFSINYEEIAQNLVCFQI